MVLNDAQIKTLSWLLSATENEVYSLCERTLQNIVETNKHRGTQLNCENGQYIYLTVPDAKYLFVAHMDTVTKSATNLVINRNVITNSLGVLGADDRAGVYGILSLLSVWEHTPFDILLTCGEESGGKGVREFVKSGLLMQNKYTLMIELDRRGSNDAVDYHSNPTEVKAYVESFGFVSTSGSYSDISTLTAEYLIPSVNLSIGYYSQHTASEKLHIDEMVMTINRCRNMLKDPLTTMLQASKKTYTYGAWAGGKYSTYYDDDNTVYAYSKHKAYKTDKYSNINKTCPRTKLIKPTLVDFNRYMAYIQPITPHEYKWKKFLVGTPHKELALTLYKYYRGHGVCASCYFGIAKCTCENSGLCANELTTNCTEVACIDFFDWLADNGMERSELAINLVTEIYAGSGATEPTTTTTPNTKGE